MGVNCHGDEDHAFAKEVANDGIPSGGGQVDVVIIINTIPLQLVSLSLLKMSFGSGRDGFSRRGSD